MGLPKRLTDMQKRFSEFLVFGGPEGPMSKTEVDRFKYSIARLLA